MARKFINRENAVKQVVDALMKAYPGQKTFTREQVEAVSIDTNMIGFQKFTSRTQGYGNLTRLQRGSYVIPEAWMNGSAPWDSPIETTNTAASAAD